MTLPIPLPILGRKAEEEQQQEQQQADEGGDDEGDKGGKRTRRKGQVFAQQEMADTDCVSPLHLEPKLNSATKDNHQHMSECETVLEL